MIPEEPEPELLSGMETLLQTPTENQVLFQAHFSKRMQRGELASQQR